MRRRLLILVLAALLPLIALSGSMIWLNLRQQQSAMRADAIHRVVEIIERVDRELLVQMEMLAMLSQSPALDAPLLDLDRFHVLAGRFERELTQWRSVTLLDAEARQLLRTAVPMGGALPDPRDRDTVLQVARSTTPAVSPIVFFDAGGADPQVTLHAPVLRDGAVRFVLSADIALDPLLSRSAPITFPDPAWRPFLVDAADRIVLSPRSPDAVGRLAGDRARGARASGHQGVYEGRTGEGEPVITAFRKSDLTGWSAHLSIPLPVFNAPLRRSMGVFAALGAAVIGLTAVLLWLVRREWRTQRMEAATRERLARMEALGRMTGGVAHDFNNLLMVVLANAEMLEKRAKDERIQRHAGAIRRAADKGAQLTRELLVFSRGETSALETVDLVERVGAMTGMIRQSLHGAIALDLDLPRGPCWVRLDPIQFDVAILNIAVNARDAMPEGGTLRISLGESRLPGRSGVPAYALAFSDTGGGIPPAALPHVFEPFFTTKEVGKGTGLGLAQVYGFAKASGGTADVASRPGRGTTVTLLFPRAAGGSGASAEPREADRPAGAGGAGENGARVLLVDDNQDIRSVAADILTEAGYAVTLASCPSRALADPATAEIDCLVTDIVMPGGRDGLDLARELRRRRADLPVVLMTGYAASARTAREEGFTLLAKPFRPAEIVDAVRAALDRRGGPGAPGSRPERLAS